jgi:hypothetical protein
MQKRGRGRPAKKPSASELSHQRIFFKWMIAEERISALKNRLIVVERQLRMERELNK